MGGSVGVLRLVLPTHIGHIQLSFEHSGQCIIRRKSHRLGGIMSLANSPGPDAENPRLTALPVEQAAMLLTRFGSKHTDATCMLADIALGAPVNPDGTVNLIAYGAWLVRELAKRDGAHGD
jgi:hypothetical protein